MLKCSCCGKFLSKEEIAKQADCKEESLACNRCVDDFFLENIEEVLTGYEQ